MIRLSRYLYSRLACAVMTLSAAYGKGGEGGAGPTALSPLCRAQLSRVCAAASCVRDCVVRARLSCACAGRQRTTQTER
eukprot:4216895-Pleurochrysis_carterae.AAC.2